MKLQMTKITAVLAAAALVGAAVPMVALADAEPDVTGNTGTGKTDLVVKLEKSGEYGGTSAIDPYTNPDRGDGYGANIAFTVPTQINYVVKANGTLVAPDAETVYLENLSNYPIHASSLEANATTVANNSDESWTFVSDYTDTNTTNAVQLSIQPGSGTAVSAHDYTSKTHLPETSIADWNMTSGVDTAGVVSDRVQMRMTGGLNNVRADITGVNGAKFGELVWYVTPGKAVNTAVSGS